jgi:tetratricopeptide (TPR) repeat protein
MRWRAHWPSLPVAALLTVVAAHAAFALGDRKIDAAPCSIATGENASNNSITCNFGLTDEQLKQVTAAAVKGATEPLMDRIVDISRTLGVTAEATRTLLRIVGEQTNVPEERLGEALTKVANDYKRLLTQSLALNPTNETARRLITQAKAEIEGGHFEHAHDLLRQAASSQVAAAEEARKLRKQAQVAEDAELLGAAESTAVEGDLALTERRYLEAADLFGRSAGYAPSSHPKDRVAYLNRQADALYRQGGELGDNDAAALAIESYRNILTLTLRESVPLDWAMTQLYLGNALWTLGERDNNTSRLEEAVAAFRAALEEATRERVPLQWATTQSNLGAALQTLAVRENGTSRLEEAVAAYRAALEEWTRTRVPLRWATTQSNLGAALAMVGERDNSTSRLEEAVAAFRAALEEATRERVPLQWALTQTNLGNALWLLGKRESGTSRLEEAVAAHRAALEEWTRTRVPLDWAKTQNNLGNALWMLGERESGTSRLEEAVAAYRAALEEATPEAASYLHEVTQRNLARCLASLQQRRKQ